MNLEQEDIRARWEPERLQHISAVAHAAAKGRTEGFSSENAGEFAKKAVLEWIQENPFPRSPNFHSAMECALRIPVFFSCIKTFPMEKDELEAVLESAYQHAWFVSKNLSLYSSLGNHTIAEAVGLVFAGVIFRDLSEGIPWLRTGVELLKREATHQILDDGGPCEQSFSYHRFVLDLYWMAIDFLKKNRVESCEEIEEINDRLMKGERFLAVCSEQDGMLPRIGDGDNGHAVAPGVHPKRPVVQRTTNRLQIFEQSGYSVVHFKVGTKVIFDHGPLGMAPFYNHGHADALSIILSKNGKELLVDPGTYRYNGVPEYRRYFKGTRAHNTVTIDGLDQAVQETSFIWSRPYRAVLEKAEESDGEILLKASHDGYSRLKQPVIHKRALMTVGEEGLIVKDVFLGTGVHTFELNFHLHPEASFKDEDGWLALEDHGEKIFLKLMGKHEFRFAEGEEAPIFGWYSPTYGIKFKSGVLSCQVEGAPSDVSFLTAIGVTHPLDSALIRRKGNLL
ncbi:heparinase II/III-like protein [delta proteobacterium NaphS2]|nr:heparinase II/III-like protein [delta proteobacterium NaphS2]